MKSLMNSEEKKRLKKIGKELVKKRSHKLRETLSKTNPANFSSDQYLKNEIEIRKREKQLRSSSVVKSLTEAEKEYVIISAEEVGQQNTFGYDLYWLCKNCNFLIPSEPEKPERCNCQNIYIEPIQLSMCPKEEKRTVELISAFNVNQPSGIVLVKLLPKVTKSHWWQFWK